MNLLKEYRELKEKESDLITERVRITVLLDEHDVMFKFNPSGNDYNIKSITKKDFFVTMAGHAITKNEEIKRGKDFLGIDIPLPYDLNNLKSAITYRLKILDINKELDTVLDLKDELFNLLSNEDKAKLLLARDE